MGNKLLAILLSCFFLTSLQSGQTSKEDLFINEGAKSRDTLHSSIENSISIEEENEESVILNSKQIEAAALLFDLNLQQIKERGINWQAILSKHGLVLGSDIKTFTKNPGTDYTFNIQLEGDVGVFSAYTNALFKYLESENLGKIAARLSVTVRNGQQGRMQVGSDFSIKQRDFAGNIIDVFYPTGTIIKILPKIYSLDTLDYALLKVDIERSIPFPDIISTEVKKTNATSEIIMQNNEEAVVGGLLYTEQIKVRSGIPVLKDLPWWVLGLRYLTGYDRLENNQREVLMFIKIRIIPSLYSRLKL